MATNEEHRDWNRIDIVAALHKQGVSIRELSVRAGLKPDTLNLPTMVMNPHHYPGFETDIHGAYRQPDGRYTVKVIKNLR